MLPQVLFPNGCGTAGLPSRGGRPVALPTAGQASRATFYNPERPRLRSYSAPPFTLDPYPPRELDS